MRYAVLPHKEVLQMGPDLQPLVAQSPDHLLLIDDDFRFNPMQVFLGSQQHQLVYEGRARRAAEPPGLLTRPER